MVNIFLCITPSLCHALVSAFIIALRIFSARAGACVRTFTILVRSARPSISFAIRAISARRRSKVVSLTAEPPHHTDIRKRILLIRPLHTWTPDGRYSSVRILHRAMGQTRPQANPDRPPMDALVRHKPPLGSAPRAISFQNTLIENGSCSPLAMQPSQSAWHGAHASQRTPNGSPSACAGHSEHQQARSWPFKTLRATSAGCCP